MVNSSVSVVISLLMSPVTGQCNRAVDADILSIDGGALGDGFTDRVVVGSGRLEPRDAEVYDSNQDDDPPDEEPLLFEQLPTPSYRAAGRLFRPGFLL